MNDDYLNKMVDGRLESIESNDNIYDVGTVINVKDFIIEIFGMNNVMFYERINIGNKCIRFFPVKIFI